MRKLSDNEKQIVNNLIDLSTSETTSIDKLLRNSTSLLSNLWVDYLGHTTIRISPSQTSNEYILNLRIYLYQFFHLIQLLEINGYLILTPEGNNSHVGELNNQAKNDFLEFQDLGLHDFLQRYSSTLLIPTYSLIDYVNNDFMDAEEKRHQDQIGVMNSQLEVTRDQVTAMKNQVDVMKTQVKWAYIAVGISILALIVSSLINIFGETSTKIVSIPNVKVENQNPGKLEITNLPSPQPQKSKPPEQLGDKK